ncbi:flagellar assembly protein FliW [Paenibacillus glacialis]|uniref:Flagellar assembly factor FliW n=1 Tax=Paenibacillus glacialis TaxID=494026 RepID=A0A162K4L3_9BACL|nr:flagellar assembly protein FliW [Paenibacillus glacialis]OAB42936.1 flagellar assembly protein FliW [Paenibacillus glacialis]
MFIQTTAWGEIEVDSEQVYLFAKGLSGFEEETEFVIFRPEEGPFCYLQSVREPKLSFMLSDPFTFYPDYEFELNDTEREELDIVAMETQIIVHCMVTLSSNIERSTLNLLAPLVFNPDKRMGKQVVLHHTTYQTRHQLFVGSEVQSSREAE